MPCTHSALIYSSHALTLRLNRACSLLLLMDVDECSSSSSPPSSSSSSTARPFAPPAKRKAGRKKFRETRHPVFHGVRSRGGGGGFRKWVSEVREPRKKTRIWLGTFPTPEMAARAHDVAAIALRGAASARLNFPDSASALPRARSAAPEDVRRAAAEAAGMTAGVDSAPQSSSAAAPPQVFVDEEELFNLPGLMDDMARGLLVTPPAMHRAFDWENMELEEDGYVAGDIVSLWQWIS